MEFVGFVFYNTSYTLVNIFRVKDITYKYNYLCNRRLV